MIAGKDSIVLSALRQTCPKCHRGHIFIKNNPYDLKNGSQMYTSCPVCHQDYKIEPGFYIGALWMSFPIVIIIMALLSVLLLMYLKLDLTIFFIVLTITLFLLQPIITRLGRSIWIHIFVKYDQEAANPESDPA